MTEAPLIYTARGNLPVASLTHHVEWKVTPEQIVFIEAYSLDGEIVKQSAHVHVLTGTEIIGAAAI